MAEQLQGIMAMSVTECQAQQPGNAGLDLGPAQGSVAAAAVCWWRIFSLKAFAPQLKWGAFRMDLEIRLL